MSSFWSFFEKKADAKAELLAALEAADPASRDAVIAALRSKLDEWIAANGPVSLARVALMNGKRFADLATLPGDAARVASYVGLALDAIGTLRDIAILAAVLEAGLRLPGLATTFLNVGAIAAQLVRAATTAARVQSTLQAVYTTLSTARSLTSIAQRVAQIEGAKKQFDAVQAEAISELSVARELELPLENAAPRSAEFEAAELDGPFELDALVRDSHRARRRAAQHAPPEAEAFDLESPFVNEAPDSPLVAAPMTRTSAADIEAAREALVLELEQQFAQGGASSAPPAPESSTLERSVG